MYVPELKVRSYKMPWNILWNTRLIGPLRGGGFPPTSPPLLNNLLFMQSTFSIPTPTWLSLKVISKFDPIFL